jgi:hypothetical protein
MAAGLRHVTGPVRSRPKRTPTYVSRLLYPGRHCSSIPGMMTCWNVVPGSKLTPGSSALTLGVHDGTAHDPGLIRHLQQVNGAKGNRALVRIEPVSLQEGFHPYSTGSHGSLLSLVVRSFWS